MRHWLVPAGFALAASAVAAHAVEATNTAITSASSRHILLAVYAALRTAVALAFVAFTVRRAEPQRPSREPLAFAVCALAMVAVLVVLPPPRATGSVLLLAGDAVAVIGCIWLLASVLCLGRCFGVLPEARGLVQRGPYRIVRHPVYLGEITALVGLTLAAPRVWNVGVLIAFAVAQDVRARLEERALSEAFPEYSEYGRRTGRLLPVLGRYPVVRSSGTRRRTHDGTTLALAGEPKL